MEWVRRDQRHRTSFLARFRATGAVLDVGCGLGLFLRALDPAQWNRYGVEPMPVPHQEAARWLGPDHVFRNELTAAALPAEQIDVVTFWDSLEHLADPRATLTEAFRLLRPRGLVLISLPNFESYQAKHFREDWFALSLPYHLYHYTPATLTRLLETCGFRVRIIENRESNENYHSLKHSLLNRLTRLHGRKAGHLRYYLLKPFLRPWERLTTRLGGGSSIRLCADVVKPPM
jgi:SAM-dependent methyltransferase